MSYQHRQTRSVQLRLPDWLSLQLLSLETVSFLQLSSAAMFGVSKASDMSHAASLTCLVQNQAEENLLCAALYMAPFELLVVLHSTSGLPSIQLPGAELLSAELQNPDPQSSELASQLVEAECRGRLQHLNQRRHRQCVSA